MYSVEQRSGGEDWVLILQTNDLKVAIHCYYHLVEQEPYREYRLITELLRYPR